MRIFIKTSAWAIWAGRFGRLVIPLYVVSVGAHHIELIDSDIFVFMFGLATLVGLAALGLGTIAFVRLWYTGDHGWGTASWANLIGLAAVGLLGLTILLGAQYPVTNQVTTNIENPPALNAPALETEAKQAELSEMAQEVAISFPTAVTRAYPLGGGEMLLYWNVKLRRRVGTGT